MSLNELTFLIFIFSSAADATAGNSSSCIFGVKDGSPSGTCTVNNAAAIGIISAIVGVILIGILVFIAVYCWKGIKEAGSQGIHFCSNNCHCCHRQFMGNADTTAPPSPPPYKEK